MRADSAHLRSAVHRLLLDELPPEAEIDRATIAAAVSRISPLVDPEVLEVVVDEVDADLHGLGALESLVTDPEVTDVMVVGGRGVWVERRGQMLAMDRQLRDEEIAHLIERIVAPLGLRIDRASPMVDARLPDGSRVNAVVPPLAVDGPCLTIRRFGARHIELSQMAQPAVARLLEAAVRARRNIIVSGGTGSGKTTLLNALSRFLGESERVITVEDAAELRIPLRHVVRLESRPANTEGVGVVSIRDLVRNALRMRPDRIIVGEVRSGEAFDMLQAMNTGHEGSMSTCHANSEFDALRRIETMVLMGESGLSLDAVRQQIQSSVDLVVQIQRHNDGSRSVVSVSEVVDADGVPMARRLADHRSVVAVPTRPSRFQRS